MSETRRRRSKLSSSQAATIRKYAREIADLPPVFHSSEKLRDDPNVDCPFRRLDSAVKSRLRCTGTIKRVERRGTSGGTVNIWRVPEAVRKRADKCLIEQSETPIPGCPHSGVSNVRDGGYTCGREDCDVEVSREEVRL
jgi:hypothetical protein